MNRQALVTLAWSAAAPVAMAVALSPMLPDGEAIRLGALAALAISVAAGLVTRPALAGGIGQLLAALLAAMGLRLMGLLLSAWLLHLVLGPAALPGFLALAGCVIASLIIETALGVRQLGRAASAATSGAAHA